jgi:integrase
MPRPFFHQGNKKWAVSYGKGLSGIGKPRVVYYDSRESATADIKKRERDRKKFGQETVSVEDKTAILFLRQQIGDLSKLPAVIQHWLKTGPEAIEPTLVSDAVSEFQDWQIPRVKARTQSDLRYRLNAFASAFKDAYMHELNAGDIETWLYAQGKPWSVRSFYKRLCPLFSHAVRHRMIADNPMRLIKAPEVPSGTKLVYSGDQFNSLLSTAFIHPDRYLLSFLCLTGFAWARTSELVRLYSTEDVLCWEDIDFEFRSPEAPYGRIHIRESVGKQTRRKSGNERLIPIIANLLDWLGRYASQNTGPVVPVLHHEFAESMRALHAEAGVKPIHNGLRRSAISMYLASHPETGIGQLARWAGSSEQTVKAHYLEILTPEDGKQWFRLKHPRIRIRIRSSQTPSENSQDRAQ